MSFKAWPFLVSRNRYIDYRTIVAPDFICDAKIPNLLARVAEEDLTEPNQAIIRQVVNSKVDDFTIVFQVVMAKEKDIDTKGNDRVIIDQFGREIYLFEGVVIKGIGDVYLIDKDLEKAHEKSMEIYRKFWKCIDPFPVTPSQYFSTGTIDSGKLLKLEKIRRFDAKYQRKLVPIKQVNQD